VGTASESHIPYCSFQEMSCGPARFLWSTPGKQDLSGADRIGTFNFIFDLLNDGGGKTGLSSESRNVLPDLSLNPS
jgi:hypothetical protein